MAFVSGDVPWNKGIKYKLENKPVISETSRKRMNEGVRKYLSEKLAKELWYFDLTKPEIAYFWGFAQTDGHLSGDTRPGGNRGHLVIEINNTDVDILNKIKQLFEDKIKVTIFTRIRNTNFKKKSISSGLRICNRGFREGMKLLGFPQGKKSTSIAPPPCDFSEVDYVRGLIDGDGSLGFASSGKPFVSFVTTSESIKEYYIDFLSNNIGILKNNYRNERDGVFNILLSNEDAVNFSKIVYYEGAISMNRKMNIAKEIKKWVRPRTLKKWTNLQRESYNIRSELKQIEDILGESAI